jgi:hypothetical protein
MVGTSGDWRHQAWLALLVVAIGAFSFVYACAPPFAAFSVLAALTLSRRDAIRTTVTLWLVNQAVGYVILGYPRTVNSFTWGLIMGVAAVLATLLAGQIVARLRTVGGLTRAIVALGGAFATYEVVLYAIAVAGLGGRELRPSHRRSHPRRQRDRPRGPLCAPSRGRRGGDQ